MTADSLSPKYTIIGTSLWQEFGVNFPCKRSYAPLGFNHAIVGFHHRNMLSYLFIVEVIGRVNMVLGPHFGETEPQYGCVLLLVFTIIGFVFAFGTTLP